MRKQQPKPLPSAAAFAGERVRLSSDSTAGGLAGSLTTYQAPDSETRWRSWDLDSQTLDRLSPAELVKLLCDLSPDVSRALWDFLRMCNPGWEVRALGADGETIDPKGQAILDAFMARLQAHYGSADIPINRLFTAAFVRGNFFAEIVMDERGREALDLATPDPNSIQWRKRIDEERGEVWEPFQWQKGKQVAITGETVRIVPVDPLPGEPWGRAPVSPALFTVLFTLGLLHDLRRVVSQQGYPRLDIEIDLEMLKAMAPANVQRDSSAFTAWVAAVVTEIRGVYETLQPDDAYVHPSFVKVNRPVGTVDADSLAGVDALLNFLETQAIRALKSMPLLFGAADGVSEANANRQWEIHVAGIKALQHLNESLLEHLLGIVLRAQGSQARAEFRFAELRASEMLRDAQTEAAVIANALQKYLNGWISQDQAAAEGAGVEAADAPEPRAQAAAGPPEPDAETVDPGANRWLKVPGGYVRILGTEAALADVPEKVPFSETEIDAALEEWDRVLPEYEGLLDAEVI